MELNIKQINELLNGVVLACELNSKTPEIRKFLTVKSFHALSKGKYIPWNNTIKFCNTDDVVFIIHYYSVFSNFIENDYDIGEEDLVEDIIIDNIYSWNELYHKLSEIIDNFDILTPQWNCDNPLD